MNKTFPKWISYENAIQCVADSWTDNNDGTCEIQAICLSSRSISVSEWAKLTLDASSLYLYSCLFCCISFVFIYSYILENTDNTLNAVGDNKIHTNDECFTTAHITLCILSWTYRVAIAACILVIFFPMIVLCKWKWY